MSSVGSVPPGGNPGGGVPRVRVFRQDGSGKAPTGYPVADGFSLNDIRATVGANANTIVVVQMPQAAPPAAPAEVKKPKGFFGRMASWVGEKSKAVAKVIGGAVTTFVGGGGAAMAGASVANLVAPRVMHHALMSVGLVGWLPAGIASVMTLGLGVAVMVAGIAIGRTFWKAGKAEDK